MRRLGLIRSVIAGSLVAGSFALCACGTNLADNNSEVVGTKEVVLANEQTTQPEKTREIILTQNSQYPDYYENEVRVTIDTFNKSDTKDSVSYIYATDFHLDSNEASTVAAYRQIAAIVDLANNTDVDFVCIGGDLYDGRHSEENGKANAMAIIQSVCEPLKMCNKPVFILHGNHDDNSFSAQNDPDLFFDANYIINKQEWYSVTMANYPQYATDYHNGYFYYDLPGKNARVVCLNMSDSSETVVDGVKEEMGMYFYGYKDEQIKWFLEKALSRENCQYYIMSHDAFEYPGGYNPGSNRDTLQNILTAAYAHKNYNDSKFSKDFSKWTGQMMLLNVGHLHLERVKISADYVAGMPILNTDKAKVQSSNRPWGNFGDSGYTTASPRTANTIDEACFNIVISKPHQLQIIRFGSGQDKVYNY